MLILMKRAGKIIERIQQHPIIVSLGILSSVLGIVAYFHEPSAVENKSVNNSIVGNHNVIGNNNVISNNIAVAPNRTKQVPQAGNQASLPKKEMSEQPSAVSSNHPSMQIFGEKTFVDSAARRSEIAFKYNAILENSGMVPIRFERLYVQFGAEGGNSWTLSLQNSFYLKPNEIYSVEYTLPWWRVDEITKGRTNTNTTYKIHIIARFQDERGATVERSRWIGSFDNSSPSPVINGGNILN